jgi:hypothetical protein
MIISYVVSLFSAFHSQPADGRGNAGRPQHRNRGLRDINAQFEQLRRGSWEHPTAGFQNGATRAQKNPLRISHRSQIKSSRESAGGRAGTEEMGSLKIQFDLGMTHQHRKPLAPAFREVPASHLVIARLVIRCDRRLPNRG